MHPSGGRAADHGPDHPRSLVIAALAIAFSQLSGEPRTRCCSRVRRPWNPIVSQAGTISLGTIALLVLLQGLPGGVSLSSALGGPMSPAIFLGIAGGLLASHLPASATPAVSVLVGATVVSVLQLPLSSIIIALLVTQAGAGVAPLIIVGVVGPTSPPKCWPPGIRRSPLGREPTAQAGNQPRPESATCATTAPMTRVGPAPRRLRRLAGSMGDSRG